MPMPPPTANFSLRQLAECDERVFPTYPQVARYFPAAAMEDARKRLGRAIERGDGPGLVVGGPGTGKSLLLQVLAAHYHKRFDVVLLGAARLCTRRALLQAVLFELGLPYKLRDEGELRLSLIDHLLSVDECPTGLLLLVDEAQSLPLALLDELRVMTNLVRGDQPRVRLVLAGSSALEEAFAHPELESFSQRLAARCYLTPLSREETTQYVRAQFAAAGGSPDELVAADAWSAVFEATDGVPRLVNQLCDRALQFGAVEGRHCIDRAVVERAWTDLQQLPSPWETPAETMPTSGASQVVEFGCLTDAMDAGDESDGDPAVIEPTELDEDEDVLDVADPTEPVVCTPRRVADPFAEDFDEEEVVLDNFAAWDDMFRRETPRVENRRDPGFSTLVQVALDASAESPSPSFQTSTLGIVEDADKHATGNGEADADDAADAVAEQSTAETESDPNWPPLRLAVVSDPAPLKPIPLLPPSGRGNATEGEAIVAMAMDTVLPGQKQKSDEESPILVIEEDSRPRRAEPPARRENYRNLFSRLRSG